MSNWFECKVKFDKVQKDGAVKKVTEPYLVDALSFTEAEARVIEELKPFIGGDFQMSAVKRTKITEIFWDETGDKWYLAKLVFDSIDPVSGAEKKITTQILLQAKDFGKAYENVLEGMNGTASDYEIVSINETPIMDVYKVKLNKF